MKILFVHEAYASQFLHLLRWLTAAGGHELTFLSSVADRRTDTVCLGEMADPVPGVRRVHFRAPAGAKTKHDSVIGRFSAELAQAEAVHAACAALRARGYTPDVVVCHGRWGAGLLIKEAWPEVPLLLYSEYFSTIDGARRCLPPGAELAEAAAKGYRLANATALLSMDAADRIVTPTQFQKDTHPEAFHDRICVVFDGVDAARLTPRDVETIDVSGASISAQDEIVTYITRNFEPYRGFESFMQAVKILQDRRPRLRVLIGGGCSDTGYGPGEAGMAYCRRVVAGLDLDSSRVHFLGPLNYAQHVHLLRFSQVHVYLTVPFVLSWSMLEAMSLGCAIVGSRTAPVQEVIGHDVNGLLAGLYDPREIAAQAAALLDDPERRKRLGAAARQTVLDRYDVAVTGPQWLKLLEEMAGGG